MGLLSDLLTRPFRRPAKEVASPIPDRRVTPRYPTTLPVSLRKSELPPFDTTLINISTTGAAIALLEWDPAEPVPWPTRLKHGDEIVLTGLLDVPLQAWVVAMDEVVLRVRFLVDDTARGKLHEMITSLATVE
jgi:PilZ domain